MTIERDYRTDDDYRTDQSYAGDHGDTTDAGTDLGIDTDTDTDTDSDTDTGQDVHDGHNGQDGLYGNGADVPEGSSQDELGVIDVPGSAQRSETGDEVVDGDTGDHQLDDSTTTTTDATTATSSGTTGAHAADPDWQTLQGRFVDDPASAVREAADLVEDGVRRLLDSLREDLDGQDDAASTEQKRVAFQRYRAVYTALQNV